MNANRTETGEKAMKTPAIGFDVRLCFDEFGKPRSSKATDLGRAKIEVECRFMDDDTIDLKVDSKKLELLVIRAVRVAHRAEARVKAADEKRRLKKKAVSAIRIGN
jgi:hypothetical protein